MKDFEDEFDEDDMPCRCDCGTWFDLLDGWPSRYSDKVICDECHENELNDDRV